MVALVLMSLLIVILFCFVVLEIGFRFHSRVLIQIALQLAIKFDVRLFVVSLMTSEWLDEVKYRIPRCYQLMRVKYCAYCIEYDERRKLKSQHTSA